MPVRRVCASAYNGYQNVSVTFRNWKWLDGQWKLYGYNPLNATWKPTLTQTVRLAPNTCQDVNGVYWLVAATSADLAGGSGPGHYSSDIVFRWSRTSNGAYLGRKYIDYSGNDYLCDTNLPNACSTGTGWVWLKGFSR